MADNLVFSIKFDLEKGVKDALADGDKALDRIAKALERHPITIKLRMDNRVVRGTSTELTGFKKQLAELTQQWNSLTAAERGSAAGSAIREKFRALRAEAQGYTSTLQAAVKAEDKLRESHSKTAANANKLSSAYHNQSTYLSRLIQRMAAYAGVSYVGNFLTNVREVTAQFELQRISLGAIIQDQQRANQLFEEIKTFALKSPVKILDLTKYTKQLAAYKFETEELFDWTKRLTDISVGLGVSMDRIVLMAGQIRATGHLRASEVRQATEAGIPLVEELAAKLSKMNGEMVTSAQVMDLISKRAISWDLVKEVFTDMTSAGGIFYNMQEKQGNTLFGMWQKLGDAAAVMYDQIGNTSSVNEGMKMAIQTLRYLMLHWKQVGIVVGGVSVYILANTIATKNNAIATATATTANKLHIASLQQKLGALRLEQMNLKSTAIFQRLHTAATISATKAQIGAATSTNVFSKALYGLKAALLSNPLTALAVALTTIIALLMQSESELDKLNSKLQDIDRDYDASGKKSVDRFKELVKAVEENVDGSKAQKEALDELDRTYGKILGSEALELDSLKALGGQYGALIDLIEAYNAKKRGEEKETAIKSSYATILDEEKDDLMDYLNQAGMSAEKQAEFISRLNEKMIEHAGEADAAIKATNETFQEFANDISQLDAAGNILNVLNFDKLADAWGVGFRKIGGLLGGQGMDYLYNYAHALEGQNKALDENEVATRNAVRGLDEYAGRMDNLTKAINTGKDAILDWSSQEALYNSLQKFNTQHPENAISIPIDLTFDPAKAETEYDKMLESSNMRIHAIFANLQSIASQEGITIPEEFYKQAKSVVEGNKDFSFIDFDGLAKLFTTDKAKNAVKESRLLYESIAPSDDTVRMFNRKFMTLADNMDVSLDKMQKYLMKSGDNLGEHRKKLSDEVTNLLKDIARLEWTKKALTLFGLPADAVEAKIQESQQTLKLLQSMISTIPDIEGIGKKKKGGTKSDPRLQNLKEEISLTKKLYDEYHKLETQIGATKAAKKIQEIYSNTIKTLQDRAGKYGFKFELPFTDENLKSNMQHFIDKMKELQGLKDKKGKPLFPNIGKDIDEAVAQLEDVDLNSLQKALEKQLKRLADRISRTKTAKEFYEKILGMTGDYDLAAKVSLSIYGDMGYDLQKQLAEQVRQYFQNDQVSIEIPVDVITADNQINYKRLGEFAEQMKEKLGEEPYKAIKKIAEEGQKDLAKTYEGYLKDLEKAKTYADKRVELARTTAEKLREIDEQVKAGNYTKEVGEEKKHGYMKRQEREEANLEWEAFKEMPIYVQMFEDLEHASTSTLTLMKNHLTGLKGLWGTALDPAQLKEIAGRIEEIESQLQTRNPWKTLRDSWREYKTALSSYDVDDAYARVESATEEYVNATLNFGENSAQAKEKKRELEVQIRLLELSKKLNKERLHGIKKLDRASQDAMKNYRNAVTNLGLASAEEQEAIDKYGKDSDQAKAKHEAVEAAREELKIAEKVAELTQENADTAKGWKVNLGVAAGEITKYMTMAADAAHAVADLTEAFGGSEEDVQFWNDIGDGLEKVTEGFSDLMQNILSLNVAGIISSAITALPKMIIGFLDIFSAGRIRKANKEIKRQQELLDQFEYAYSRLEKAAERLFGAEYIENYNARLAALQKQQAAYLKQAEAERSKGKKEDEEKTQEFLDNARDAANEIADMQDEVRDRIAGTDITSAARDFALAWLEAKASFGDTTDAMREKFKDMVQNMIVESMAAKIVEGALQPFYRAIDDAAAGGTVSAEEIAGAVRIGLASIDDMNAGMEILWDQLREAGIDMNGILGDARDGYTGIAKDIAGATSEEINRAAAVGNTLLYYAAPIPRIDENLARVVAIMEGRGASAAPQASSAGWTDWQKQAMDNYQAIARNTADTVTECRRAAQACEDVVSRLRLVIVSRGGEHGVNTFLRQ